MLVVQVVDILWTKATRGAPRAAERVALPRAFPISAVAPGCLIQSYRMAEWEAFRPTLAKTELLDHVPGSEGVLRITSRVGQVFTLGITGTPHNGQPRRHAVSELLQLMPGERARVALNARHSSYSGQHYAETIFNVTSGDAIPADRFLRGQPDHDIDLKAHLF